MNDEGLLEERKFDVNYFLIFDKKMNVATLCEAYYMLKNTESLRADLVIKGLSKWIDDQEIDINTVSLFHDEYDSLDDLLDYLEDNDHDYASYMKENFELRKLIPDHLEIIDEVDESFVLIDHTLKDLFTTILQIAGSRLTLNNFQFFYIDNLDDFTFIPDRGRLSGNIKIRDIKKITQFFSLYAIMDLTISKIQERGNRQQLAAITRSRREGTYKRDIYINDEEYIFFY